MPPVTEPQSRTSTPRSFTHQTASAEDLLKSQTVGLVNLHEFRKRRADILEQKEREAHDKSLGRITAQSSRSATPSGGDITDSGIASQNDLSQQLPRKRKKKLHHPGKSKLSFEDDDSLGTTSDEPKTTTTAAEKDRNISPTTSTTPSGNVTPEDAAPRTSHARRITANPNLNLPVPKLVTKAALEAEVEARDALRREFLALQDKVKATEILIPFVFYDGTNIPGGTVKVKKGDPIWLFLDRCRKVGAELGVGATGSRGRGRKEYRKEWARVGVDDLMLIRGQVIIPHHYEFYYFIGNRVPSYSGSGGLLFDYSSSAPPPPTDGQPPAPEGGDADPTFTKVVDRRWYERNKHIFPASLWREYEPGKEFEEKMGKVRRDAEGNSFFF